MTEGDRAKEAIAKPRPSCNNEPKHLMFSVIYSSSFVDIGATLVFVFVLLDTWESFLTGVAILEATLAPFRGIGGDD